MSTYNPYEDDLTKRALRRRMPATAGRGDDREPGGVEPVETGIPSPIPSPTVEGPGGPPPAGPFIPNPAPVEPAPSIPPPAVPTPGPVPGDTHTPVDPRESNGFPSPQQGGVLHGFDTAKLNDPNHTTPKYVFARIAQNYPATPEGLRQMANDPAFQRAGFKLVGTDKIQLPNGEIIDVGLKFSTGGGVGWWWGSDSAGEAGGATGGGAGGNNPFTGGAGGGGSSPWGGGGNAGFNDMIRQQIMALLSGNPDPTQSPTFQGATRAYDVSSQRNSDRMRNAIAERMGAQGMSDSGAMDTAVLGAEQQAGESRNQFTSQLAVQQLTEQRDQMMQALQMGANLMSEEQRLALTERLGMINAALQQQGMNNQNSQYYAGLSQNNTQFNDTLGWQMAQWQYLQGLLPFLTGQ